MSNVKIYEVEHYPSRGSITVEIDFDHISEVGGEKIQPHGLIKQMVDFWAGSEDRLKANENEYLKTFLKQLCELCLKIQIAHNYNTQGVVEEFEGMEGYCSMDGADGIKIRCVSASDFEDQDDYSITYIEKCEES